MRWSPIQTSERLLFLELLRLDRERGWLALLAPPSQRPAIAALFALDAELGRIALRVEDPMAGLIRFAWWREALLKAAAQPGEGHLPLFLAPLAPLLGARLLFADDLLALLAAHEAVFETRQIPDVEAAWTFADRTAGQVHADTMRLIGGDGSWSERARRTGRALALLQLAIRLPLYTRGGFRLPPGHGMRGLALELAEAAKVDLEGAHGLRPPRHLLMPLLGLRLARYRLRRLESVDFAPERVASLPPPFPLPALLSGWLLGRP